jgi:hypothetical protein
MADYYVDLNTSAGSHVGTTGDPFSVTNFVTNINGAGVANTYYLKGQGSVDCTGFSIQAHIFRAWDLVAYGPWRLNALYSGFQSGEGDYLFSEISDGIISVDSSFNPSRSSSVPFLLKNCYVKNVNNGFSLGMQNTDNLVTLKGCTMVGNGGFQLDGSMTLQDSAFFCGVDEPHNDTKHVSMINCAFSGARPDANITVEDCQFGWVSPIAFDDWPIYNAAQSAFSSTLLSAGITTPEPGAGYPSYTGYSTGLFGSPRTGIGAMDFPVVPTTPAPIVNYKDISADVNVVDFKISEISNPVMSDNFNKTIFIFIGVADPQNTDVSLIDYQYSLNNGVTWLPMTAAAGSELTGLTFSPAGVDHNFIWAIKHDIGNSIYNIPIKIRFRAQATFDSDILQTAYKQKTITIVKNVIIPKTNVPPIFPADYSGVNILRKKPST